MKVKRILSGDSVNNGRSWVHDILGIICFLAIMAMCFYISIFTNLVPIGY